MTILNAICKSVYQLGSDIGAIPDQITLNDKLFDALHKEIAEGLRTPEYVLGKGSWVTVTQLVIYVHGFGKITVNRGS